MKSFATSILILFLTSGCSFQTQSIKTFTVLSTISGSTFDSKIDKTLKIASPISPSSLSTKAIHYIRESNQAGNYLYSTWSDTPSSMIENTLFDQLQHNNLFKSIAPSVSLANSDYLLESNLLHFEHTIKNDGNSVGIIDITYRLIDNNTKKMIGTKRFIAVTPATSADAYGGVKALNQSLDLINADVATWLHSTLIRP